MKENTHRTVSRTFFNVGDRQVHCRSIGQGPPALFLHGAPADSSFVVDDMLAQADLYRCFAFDAPGFGLSDPLPLVSMAVADLADATAAAIDALGLPPLPVFGTHSGAAIALELGYRYPEKVTGLVLDGVPIFTRAEVEWIGDEHFAPLVPDVLGGHYAATWTRFRDQSIWFPWRMRTPDNLNDYDMPGPENLHHWCMMFFAAAPHYRAAYRATTSYCEDAVRAAAGLQVPAVFTAIETDMLHPHLERLPPLRSDQHIVLIGNSTVRKRALTSESFATFGSSGIAAASLQSIGATQRILKQFWMDGSRAQMFRYLGDPANPPLILLHDAPGSSLMMGERMATLAPSYFVIAPDIAGSGGSEGIEAEAELSAYADSMWRLMDALDIDSARIEGHGLGASLAVEMAASAPARCQGLAIDGLLLPDAEQRRKLSECFAPPIAVERDGAHWYRLWLQLRDSLVYWPWYDTRRTALRRVATPFDADALHDWTVEVMRQGDRYHHFPQAALRHDAAARLADLALKVEKITDSPSALDEAYGRKLDYALALISACGSSNERMSA